MPCGGCECALLDVSFELYVSPPPPHDTRARVVFLLLSPTVPECVLVCLARGLDQCVYCATHVHRWVGCEVELVIEQ